MRLLFFAVAVLFSGGVSADGIVTENNPILSQKPAVCAGPYRHLRETKTNHFEGCSMSRTDDLVIYPVPSLIALLLNRESAKGSPLTEEEVVQIRENCEAIAVPPDVAREMDRERGYVDIDPEHCWDEWQRAREELIDQ